jgi:hypothetical protein
MGKEMVGYPFPSFFLPCLENREAMSGKGNEAILESLPKMNVKFPDSTNLDDIGRFELSKFHCSDPSMQESSDHGFLKKSCIRFTVLKDLAQFLIGVVARNHIRFSRKISRGEGIAIWRAFQLLVDDEIKKLANQAVQRAAITLFVAASFYLLLEILCVREYRRQQVVGARTYRCH